MKKIISMIVVAAILLSVSSITAFASSGPYIPIDPGYMGARLGIFLNESEGSKYILKCDEGAVVDNDAVAGASYDLASNTLTLTDFDYPDSELFGYYMGDDFTLNIVGTCNLKEIFLVSMFTDYSTSLTITGTGTLNVNQDKSLETAVYIENSSDSMSAVSIGNDVTVNLYGKKPISLYGTKIDDKNKAITAGGKPADGVDGNEISYNEFDEIHTITYSTHDELSDQGYRVYREDDPDAVYVAESWDEEYFRVYRYVYYPEYDDYGRDLTFDSVQLSKDELLENYQFIMDSQPTEVYYFTQEQYSHRGQHGYRMTSADDPDGIYVGIEYWGWESDMNDDPDGYDIYRVYWDDEEDYYVEDETFREVEISFEELEDSPYSFVTEKVEKNKSIDCWVMPPTVDNESYNSTNVFEIVKKDDAPDKLYICEPYWDSDDFDAPPAGYYIYPVYVDETTGDYYVDSYNYDPETDFKISAEDFTASGFSFVSEIVDERIDCWFINQYYNPRYHASQAILLSKDGDDRVYGYNPNHVYISGDGEERFEVCALTYDEAKDIWFADDDRFDRMSLEEMNDAGFEVVYSDQPTRFYTNGDVAFDVMALYTDDDGGLYAYDYWNSVYRIDENNKVNHNGIDYYYADLCDDVSVDELNSTEHIVNTGRYVYWIDGDYHYAPSGEPGGGFTVNGSFTSYLKNAGITIELLQNGEQKYSASYQDDNGAYSLTNVAAGSYTLRVSKTNHVTRDYEITVAGDTTQNVKIHPKGDINGDGKTNTRDFGMAYAHAQKLKDSELTGYALKCADVVRNDGKVTSADAARINAHAQKTDPLY